MHVRAYFSCLFFVPHLRQTTFYSPPLAKIESLRENLWGLQSPSHTLLILCQKQRLCFVHAILAFNLFCWRLTEFTAKLFLTPKQILISSQVYEQMHRRSLVVHENEYKYIWAA